mmetsp:Transcript_85737/g.165058  ORF Transcript_85737/g.165058 Transcript_85737/m.165058 type:complete len:121 (-) Transcript_85737:84-446(-)
MHWGQPRPLSDRCHPTSGCMWSNAKQQKAMAALTVLTECSSSSSHKQDAPSSKLARQRASRSNKSSYRRSRRSCKIGGGYYQHCWSSVEVAAATRCAAALPTTTSCSSKSLPETTHCSTD